MSSARLILLPATAPLPPEEGITQEEMDADFLARVTAAGNMWGTNFSEKYVLGVQVDTFTSVADIEGDSNDVQGVGTGEFMVRETSLHLSGEASIDVQTFDTTTAGDGSYNCSQDGVGGLYDDHYYVQFSVYYPRATIAWRYPILGSTAFKMVNFGSYGGGQFVLSMGRFLGFAHGFINGGTDISSAVGSDFSSGPWSGAGTGIHIQNMIDTGTPEPITSSNTKTEWLLRYGPCLRWLDQEIVPYDADEPWLDEDPRWTHGWPDTRAAVNAVPNKIDGWQTYEIHLDRAADTLQIWANREYGLAPIKIWEGVGNVPFGSGSDIDEHYFLNYDTQRTAEPGVRPSPQHTYYSEIIFSKQPIKFPNPGGAPFPVPGHGDSTGLEDAFDALSAGGAANYPGGAMPEAIASTDWNGGSQGVCDWNMLFHHDHERGLLHAFGKSAASQGRHYAHLQFDEQTETWVQVGLTDFLDPGGAEVSRPAGHPYCEHTLDTTTGDFYWRAWLGQQIQRFTYTTQDWDYVIVSDGSAWIGSNPGALAFVPELYPAKTDKRGIFIWGRGRAHTLSLQDETDVELAMGSDLNDPGAAVWCPGVNMALGTGGDGNFECYAVTPGNPPTYSHLADVPIDCGGSGRMSVLIAHPVTGIPMILERDFDTPTAARVWLYDSVNDEWDLQGYTHPFAALVAANGQTTSGCQWLACSFSAYGGIGALWMNGTGSNDYNLSFHVWKPP